MVVMPFRVYTTVSGPDREQSFPGPEDNFKFLEGGVLAVYTAAKYTYYAPGYWTHLEEHKP